MIGVETRRDRRIWLAICLAIGLVSLLLRLWLFQQPVNSDDTQYFSQASQATNLRELGDPTTSNGMRLVVVALPALYSQVFDSGFHAFYGAIYTHAMLAFAGVLAFAWILGGPRIAAITCALWATSVVAIGVDTRLAPDNIGLGLSLIGLALIARVGLPRPGGLERAEPRLRVVIAAAALGGFLLWIAVNARESFFVFGGIGIGFGILSRRWWIVTASVAGGLLAGFLLEYAVMSVGFDDGLLRWRAAVAYQANVAEAGASEGGVVSSFSGYTLGDLFVRYPKLILEASGIEALIHFVGLAGFVVWGLRWRDRRSLAKLGAGLAAYVFLAFGIVSVSPIVPLMREKLRYYLTAAPLFYLAVAELIESGVIARAGGRFARWIDHRARPIGVGALASLLLVSNLWVTSGGEDFARNGNDNHWLSAARLRADARLRDRPRVLATDGRTARVTSILMSRDEPWSGEDLVTVLEQPADAYALLDWKRLNANVRNGFQAAPLTHQAYGLIEGHALVGRSVRGVNVVDTFFLGDPRPRAAEPVADRFPADWSVMCGGERTWQPAVTGKQDCADGGGDLLLYQGAGPPWRSRTGVIYGDRFVEAVMHADTATSTTMRAYLYWWAPHDTQIQRQSMGTIEVAPGARTYRMWTYLPQAAEGYRVVLRGRPGVDVSELDVRLLERHEDDDVRPLGEAWLAKPIRDRRLDVVASAIRTSAGDRAVVVGSDGLTAASGAAQLPAWTWETLGSSSRGFLIVDPARAAVGESVLDRGAVIARSLEGDSVIDVIDRDAAAPRDRVELELGFPSGWMRYRAANKELSPIDGAVAFTDEDANQEYIYSGQDLPWRAPSSGPIAAERFVEVIGAVTDAAGGGPLRVYLYWWPEGKNAKRVTQVLGSIASAAELTRFAVWTYLPKDAAAYRIGLRAGAGVTVTELRAFSVGRIDGDVLTAFGAPW